MNYVMPGRILDTLSQGGQSCPCARWIFKKNKKDLYASKSAKLTYTEIEPGGGAEVLLPKVLFQSLNDINALIVKKLQV